MKKLERLGNILIEGTTGSGKSTFIELFLTEIKNNRKIILDHQGVNFFDYKNDPKTIYFDDSNYDSFYDEILEFLDKKHKLTYIVIDEFAEVIRLKNKTKTHELFEYILENSRELKIKCVIATQIPCYSPKMKRLVNTFIKLNNHY